MTSHSSVLLHFHRADAREEFERSRRALRHSLLDRGPEDGAARLIELATSLDAGVARVKRDLLGTSLSTTEDNDRLLAWIHEQHVKILEMGLHLAKPGAPHRLAALVLFEWGETLKGKSWKERTEYARYHAIYREALGSGSHRRPLNWMVEGRGRAATLEGLYLRALLLDRFASGSLSRPQIEIVDAWLWEWMGALQGEPVRPQGAVLGVDLEGNAGLRVPGDAESMLYLSLDRLEAARRAVIGQLHRGRLVPAHGCIAELLIEEHIAVLDHLRQALRADAAAGRAERQRVAGARVEVWVGLQEIIARGVGIGAETGRWRVIDLSGSAIEQHARSRYSEASRRYLWLADASANGIGFQALAADATGIEIGELLGWRRIEGGPLALAQVVRKRASPDGQVFLGVRVITENALATKLSEVTAFANGICDALYLYIPGDDASGCRDSFIVSASGYDPRSSYRARAAGENFTLRFNRVRRSGRGWLLAGFELVPAKPVPRVPQVDTALILPEESEIDDPWGNEVSARLMR